MDSLCLSEDSLVSEVNKERCDYTRMAFLLEGKKELDVNFILRDRIAHSQIICWFLK
jgi:hypothetical protein